MLNASIQVLAAACILQSLCKTVGLIAVLTSSKLNECRYAALDCVKVMLIMKHCSFTDLAIGQNY